MTRHSLGVSQSPCVFGAVDCRLFKSLVWAAGIFVATFPGCSRAQGVTAPSSVFSCEGPLCNPSSGGYGTWTFSGSLGHGIWSKGGIEAELIVERFDSDAVVIRRKDTVGNNVGATAVYRGKLDGAHIDGGVEYSWPGHWNQPRTAHWSARIDPKVATDFLVNLQPAVVNSGVNQAIAGTILQGEFFTTTPANWGNKIIHPVRITHSGNEFSVVKLVTGSAPKAQDAKTDGEPYVRGTFDANGTAARVRGGDGNWTPTTVLLANPDHVKIGNADFIRFTDSILPYIPCDPNNALHVQNDYAWWRAKAAQKDKKKELYFCWLRVSAIGGLRDAQSAWGYALLTGDGAPRDEKQGFAFTEKAAHQGDFRGQINLSRLLAAGVGTARNEQLAQYWFHVASRNSDAPKEMQEKEGLRIFGNVVVGLLQDSFARDPICDTPDPGSARTIIEHNNYERQSQERDRRIHDYGLDCSSHAMNFLLHPD
jgi:hypothetical protein